MSKESVDLIRSLYDEVEAIGDDPSSVTPDEIDRVFCDYYDEQFEARFPPDYPEGEPVFRGREGLAEMIKMMADTWSRYRLEPERFLDAGDRVVVLLRIVAEGGASGVPIEFETTQVWTVRGRRAISMHAYRDRSEALEAAGLSE